MVVYDLQNDNLFLRCNNVAEIKIRRITDPNEATVNWEEIKTVKTKEDGLEIYGEAIVGQRLRELGAELQKYRMYVNRQGYCYVVIDYVGGGSGLHKVNGFFDWSRYGVVPKITIIWNRCKLNSNAVVIDYEEKEREFANMKLQLKEKNKELREKNYCIEKKDQELKDCKLLLKQKERELSLLTTLWERHLGTFGSSSPSFSGK